MSEKKNCAWSTLLIHGGMDGDPATGAVNVPIYQTSTFKQKGLGELTGGYEYSRSGNPTRAAVEALARDLEGGVAGFAFASGMAAISTVLALFKSGDKLLLSGNVYGGTFRVLDRVFKNFGITYEMIDTTDLVACEQAITPDVKAFYVESPANPLLTVTDIAAIATIAQKHSLLTIVDNTFMTPYLQRPLALGADIVIHSATKYLGGHSDLIAGLVVVKDASLAERVGYLQNALGPVLDPFDSFLLIRGMRTLAVRMERHCANALTLAQDLSSSAEIAKVYYPGLPSFPGADIQARQAKSGGAMISFVLASGHDQRVFFKSLHMIALAESLGGVESLVCHPATMTHAALPREVRERIGITDSLIRLSVGIEDVADIRADLFQAIAASRI